MHCHIAIVPVATANLAPGVSPPAFPYATGFCMMRSGVRDFSIRHQLIIPSKPLHKTLPVQLSTSELQPVLAGCWQLSSFIPQGLKQPEGRSTLERLASDAS